MKSLVRSGYLLLLFVCVVKGAVIGSMTSALDEDIKYGFDEYRDRCTSIGVGRLAMADGSTVTTHNNDCQECDFRITHVPARDWPEGSMRPVHDIRAAYPRYVEMGDNAIHGPDYRMELVDRSIYNWTTSVPFFSIPQVPHTYAYTLGTYAIQNEKQVSIGESTCSSVFFAIPKFAPNGKAALHMETLTELALERCDTARCAVQLMGDLGVQYGFYGPAWNENIETAQDEAGEALTVADKTETWMFHIMPDDTGSSAIWLAQRVPDDHITVVANQFVIQTFDLSDSANFLGSGNIFEIAIRNKLWSPDDNKPFNFARVFGTNRHETSFACTRRVWRVLTLAAPSLLPIFSAYTDGWQSIGYGPNLDQPYPFSVKPDKPLTVQDIMNMNRDQFEKTDFDMSSGLDSGPFGDTMRFPPASKLRDPVNGVTSQEYNAGLGFQRPISLWRTAYSTVTQSRSFLPDILGAVTWIAPYAPHHSSFVPVYANAHTSPQSLNVGTLYKFDKQANWWIHCMTSNYVSRFYKYTIDDIQAFQKQIEASLFSAQKELEPKLISLLQSSSDTKGVVESLTKFHDHSAKSVKDQWWDFFFVMVGRYRDLYRVVEPHAENYIGAAKYLSVTRGWMESIGYWGAPGTPPPGDSPMPVRAINVPSEETLEAYKEKYPQGYTAPYSLPSIFAMKDVPQNKPTNPPSGANDSDSSGSGHAGDYKHSVLLLLAGLIGAALGAVVTFYWTNNRRSGGYQQIV